MAHAFSDPRILQVKLRALFMCLPLVVMGVLSGTGYARAEIGPDAVADSTQETWKCFKVNMKSDWRGCMRSQGASEAATAASEAIASEGREGYLDGYLNLGRVDLGQVHLPTLANTNAQFVLLNAQSGIIFLHDILPHQPPADSGTRALLRRHPDAFTGGRYFPTGYRDLPGGGQRFVFVDTLVNGCRACEPVGRAIFHVDFRNGALENVSVPGYAPFGNYTSEPSDEFLLSREIMNRIASGDVRELQTQLNLKGYRAGSMDGAFGPATRSALSEFLADECEPNSQGLTQSSLRSLSGQLSDLWHRLRSNLDPQADYFTALRLQHVNGAPCGPPKVTVTEHDPRSGPLTMDFRKSDLVNTGYFETVVAKPSIYRFTTNMPGQDNTTLSEPRLPARQGQEVAVTAILPDLGYCNLDNSSRFIPCSALRDLPAEWRSSAEDPGPGSPEKLMSAISAFHERSSEHKSFGDFVTDLNTVREAALMVKDIREVLALFESSLTPAIAAQAELARANQAGLLFIGAHVTTFLVKDMYAQAAEDPANVPGVLRLVPERVALATIDAAFNISSAVVTGGASAIVGQTISTTTNIVDAVIAYKDLGRETERLVDQTLRQTAAAIKQYRDGDLPGDVALSQFEVTQTISEELASGWVKWGPSKDASDRMAIIAGLARIKVLEGEPPLPPKSVLGTGELRTRIAKMNGEHCFSCTPAFNQRYLVFADRVARDFKVRGWQAMAIGDLLDGRPADADKVESGDQGETDQSSGAVASENSLDPGYNRLLNWYVRGLDGFKVTYDVEGAESGGRAAEAAMTQVMFHPKSSAPNSGDYIGLGIMVEISQKFRDAIRIQHDGFADQDKKLINGFEYTRTSLPGDAAQSYARIIDDRIFVFAVSNKLEWAADALSRVDVERLREFPE